VQFLEQLDTQSFVKNLLLKIFLENGQKPSLFSFYSLIQNMWGFWSWPLIKVVDN
jgi:hypothetical protein